MGNVGLGNSLLDEDWNVFEEEYRVARLVLVRE